MSFARRECCLRRRALALRRRTRGGCGAAGSLSSALSSARALRRALARQPAAKGKRDYSQKPLNPGRWLTKRLAEAKALASDTVEALRAEDEDGAGAPPRPSSAAQLG